jgi:hypothetical protein
MSDDPRTVALTLNVTPGDYQSLETTAQRLNLTINDLVYTIIYDATKAFTNLPYGRGRVLQVIEEINKR